MFGNISATAINFGSFFNLCLHLLDEITACEFLYNVVNALFCPVKKRNFNNLHHKNKQICNKKVLFVLDFRDCCPIK